MSRFVCFFDKYGRPGICMIDGSNVNCDDCKYNPWKGGEIPLDRVLV